MAVANLDLSANTTFKASSHTVDEANKWFRVRPPNGGKLTLVPTAAGVLSTRTDVALGGAYVAAVGNVALVAGQAYELRPIDRDKGGVDFWVALTATGELGYVVEPIA